MPKKPKPIQLPPRKTRNVTAAKAVNQKAGPFKRKPQKAAEAEYRHWPHVFIWGDSDLPGEW